MSRAVDFTGRLYREQNKPKEDMKTQGFLMTRNDLLTQNSETTQTVRLTSSAIHRGLTPAIN